MTRTSWMLMVCGMAAFGVNGQVLQGDPVSGADNSANLQLPDTLKLTGVVRDFRERRVEGGHPDFERRPSGGFGHYVRIPSAQLDAEGKPTLNSFGYKLSGSYRDKDGRKIMPPLDHFPPADGDQSGSVASSEGGAVYSAESFAQWFRDVPGVNASRPLDITLRKVDGSSVYTFDDREDPEFSGLGGFFPINGELYGNSSGNNKNFHFTFELDTTFVYSRDAGQVFTFRGDDDVWVYIDGKLVVDIGGVHSAVTQTIDLDRLEWLEDGKEYSLKFFFAERHRTQSNFRIETTLSLRNADLPTTTALHD